jgi:hypothetical protein
MSVALLLFSTLVNADSNEEDYLLDTGDTTFSRQQLVPKCFDAVTVACHSADASYNDSFSLNCATHDVSKKLSRI